MSDRKYTVCITESDGTYNIVDGQTKEQVKTWLKRLFKENFRYLCIYEES